MPTPENANSVMLVFPTSAAPCARSRATATASAVAGAASRQTTEPACVTSPATSYRSLMLTGSPASGGSATPARCAASAWRAAARAASAYSAVNTCCAAGDAAPSSACATQASWVVSPRAMRARSEAMVSVMACKGWSSVASVGRPRAGPM